MRRRTVATRAATPPDELTYFDEEHWIDRSEPVPAHWADVTDWPDWRHLRAVRRWMDARRVWADANCRTLDEINRALYPAGYVSTRPDPRRHP